MEAVEEEEAEEQVVPIHTYTNTQTYKPKTQKRTNAPGGDAAIHDHRVSRDVRGAQGELARCAF